MECPFCHQDNDKVVDSRASGAAIRRRRECQACNRRYTTYERPEKEPRLRVVKKDGSREAYDRTKIRQGLLLALHKRQVPTSRIDEMLQEIEDELAARGELEIPSRAIGDLVMEKLKKEDQVAYVRFASVYRDFQDVSAFMHEVEPMLKQGSAAQTPGKGNPPAGRSPTAGVGPRAGQEPRPGSG
jgi:transcriptional repressor NrdR